MSAADSTGWITTTGVYRYSPTVNGSLQRRDGGTTRWWLILDVDPEMGRYLKHLFALASYRTQKVQSPLWGPHVSVIRGEEPPNKAAWERFAGQEVPYRFQLRLYQTGAYLWLPVECDAALRHREELGLPREPALPLHLTIGNIPGEGGEVGPD